MVFRFSAEFSVALVYYFGILASIDTFINFMYTAMIQIGKKKNIPACGITAVELKAFVKILRVNSIYQIAGAAGLVAYFIYRDPIRVSLALIVIHIGYLVQQVVFHNSDVILMQSFKSKLFKAS
jgi:hypothetical protein